MASSRAKLGLASLACVSIGLLLAEPPRAAARSGCPGGMALVDGRFCIDFYEASVDVIDARGRVLRRHSPYHSPSDGQRLLARVRRGVMPQAYFSQKQAAAACEAAGKRLCTNEEWVTACKGRRPTRYPYGEEHQAGRCNDSGVSPLRMLHGRNDSAAVFGIQAMNDPKLNQVPGSLAATGKFRRCRNSYGLYDMVGNLHEWTADPSGTFRGGYYLDTKTHGEGCDYRTTGHDTKYHDYSIGFRCCKGDSEPAKSPKRTMRGKRAKRSGKTHVVAKGQTLWAIARRYHVSVAELCEANAIRPDTPIQPGQELEIPPG